MNNSEDKIQMSPVKKTSLYLKISDAIYNYIRLNKLQPGDKLPSEREMSSMLETSRHSVREALRILEDRGLIEVRTGMGAYLKNPYGNQSVIAVRLHNCTIGELEELQEVLEHQSVKNCIDKADIIEKKKLYSIASEMDKLYKKNIYSYVLDHEFHDLLYTSAKNDSIRQLLEAIRGSRFIMQEEAEMQKDEEKDDIWLKTVPDHLDLAKAIIESDYEKAQSAIDRINQYGFAVLNSKFSETET